MQCESFGARLSCLRAASGLNQNQVATRLHISRQCYSHYETGQRSLPPDLIVALADLFGVSTDLLLRGREYQSPGKGF